METWLKYIRIHELDALVLARNMAALNDAPNDSRRDQSTQNAADVTPQLPSGGTKQGDRENSILNQGRGLDLRPDWSGAVETGTGPAELSAFRMLRESSGPVIGIDIDLWITRVLGLMTDTMDTYESVPKSPTQLSVVGQARVLEDHPTLLSYVTSELFTHARLAHQNGADPFKLFDGRDLWNRWVALREDIPPEVLLRAYAASIGLWGPMPSLFDFWEPWDELDYTAFDDCFSPSHRKQFDFDLSATKVDDKPSESTTWRDIAVPNPPVYEREGSVASFGSAGSHMSHTMPSPIWPASRNSLFEGHPLTVDDAKMDLDRLRARFKTPETDPSSVIQGSPIHSGAYTCTYHGCSEHFETPAMLQRHKREGHRAAASEVDQNTSRLNTAGFLIRCDRINPYTGESCGAVFSRPYDLTRHEDTAHNARKKKVRCDLCTHDKTFSRADALTRHYRVRHPDVDFPGKRRGVDRIHSEGARPEGGS